MYGPFASAKWLVPLIADVSLCCGLEEDASEDQLQLTATAILERYKWLKPVAILTKNLRRFCADFGILR